MIPEPFEHFSICPRSASNPSDMSIALCARPINRCPKATLGAGVFSAGRQASISSASQPICVLLVSQRQGRIAQMAGYPDIVPRPRAAAAQGFSLRHLANDGHADIKRPPGSIPADQLHLICMGKCEKPFGKCFQPFSHSARYHRLRQRQRKCRPSRPRAHRRHVGEIYGKRFMAQLARIGIGKKCRPDTSISVETASSIPAAGLTNAASSPMPNTAPGAGRVK